MPRVKRGKIANKRRKNILEDVKGFKYGRKSKIKMAKEGLYHALRDQFDGRRKKKGQFRRLWQIQIGAATRIKGVPYNKFINGLIRHKIEIDRKILADLAQKHENIFNKLIEISQQ